MRCFDHIDLRVPRLADVAVFHETLLPAPGFTRRVAVEGWLQFDAENDVVTEFFGVTESHAHLPNENRIAFWAESRAEVERVAEIATRAVLVTSKARWSMKLVIALPFLKTPAAIDLRFVIALPRKKDIETVRNRTLHSS